MLLQMATMSNHIELPGHRRANPISMKFYAINKDYLNGIGGWIHMGVSIPHVCTYMYMLAHTQTYTHLQHVHLRSVDFKPLC